jgi:hypothetical protein
VPSPGNPQSLNRYSYGYNNPVKYQDPTGHDAICPGCPEQTFSPMSWEQAVQAVSALAVKVPEVAAALTIGGVYAYGACMGARWAMQDIGPDYQVPMEYEPGAIQPTYGLPQASTVAAGSIVYAKAGSEIAAHIAMLVGAASVGGIPPHPGMPDPDRRDRNTNTKGLRNTLDSALKDIQKRGWSKNSSSLERWLQEKGWTETQIEDTLKQLRVVADQLPRDVETGLVKPDAAKGVLDLLKILEVIPK